MNKKVLIIGTGNIGITIANFLYKNFYDITLSDHNEYALKNPLIPSAVNTLKLDVNNEIELKAVLADKDYVINAGPYFLAHPIASAAVDTNTHYFDLTEDVKQSTLIRGLDTGNINSALVPQCGLAPGYISIAANSLAQTFDEVHTVKMRVGALPKYPTNELRYNMTWSIDGLINEYLHECNAIENGLYITTKALEGYETFVLNGDKYEAFNTSGGLGTLCETWQGKVQSMNYKTVRYPGHHYLMKFLIDDMKLSDTELKRMFEAAIPSTNQDMVLIFIEVSGVKDKKLTTAAIIKKIPNNDTWSGIQLTTASGICVMVDAHNKGILPHSGFIKQEQLSLDDFEKIDQQRLLGVYS